MSNASSRNGERLLKKYNAWLTRAGKMPCLSYRPSSHPVPDKVREYMHTKPYGGCYEQTAKKAEGQTGGV